MSSNEINRRFKEDQEFINRNVLRLGKEWQKLAKVKRPLPLHFYKSFKSKDKNEYLMTTFTRDGKMPGYNIYIAVCGNRGEVNYLGTTVNSSGILNKYTAHFLKRYRERYIKKDVSLEEALSLYMMDDRNAFRIYEDEETHTHFVYANESGLIFCLLDKEHEVMITKTYVDDSMLGESQRKAKEELIGFVRNLNDETKYYQLLSSLEFTKNAQEIYNQYFEELTT